MWLPVVLVLALWDYTSSQPITEDAENARASQYDFVKCCPCPGSDFWSQLAAGKALDGVSGLARASTDDCLCRGRDADSDGSPSLFMPHIVKPVLFEVKTPEDKEESKTFLQPEVNMASGVLETLREAADEEHRDAIARDAAREAAKDETRDETGDAGSDETVGETGDAGSVETRDAISEDIEGKERVKPLITIVINTKADDSISEASQTQESRIAPPSDFSLGQVKETIPSILKPRNKLFVLNNSASKIHEKAAVLSKGLEGLKLKNDHPIQSLLPGKEKSTLLSDLHLKNLKKLNELGTKFLKNSKDGVTDLGSTNIFDKKPPLMRKITPFNARKQPKKAENDIDASPAPSYMTNQVIESENKSPFGLKSLLPRKDIDKTKTPLTLSNLLNLKDVELIHSKPLKLNLPTLDLLPIDRSQKAENKNAKKCSKDMKEAITDVHKTPNTQILDVVPSASENQPIVIDHDVSQPNAEVSTMKDVKTSEEESSTESVMETILDPEPDSKADDDRIEIIISGDEGNEIENITVEREEFNTPDEKLSSDEMEAENILDALDTHNVNQPLVNEDDSEVTEPITNEKTDFELSTDEDIGTSQRQNFVESEEIADMFIESDELHNVIPATGADAFQFESEEAESEDFEFRSDEALKSNIEPVDHENTKTKAKNIDTSNEHELDSKSVEPNEDQVEEADSLESFPNPNLKSAEYSEDFTKSVENSGAEKDIKKNLKPSIKERISIKFKTANKPKIKVLTISEVNEPVEKNKNTIEENVSDTNSPGLGTPDPENTGGFESKQPTSNEVESITENTLTVETEQGVVDNIENNDMSLSASSLEPKVVKAVPEDLETFPREDNLCPCSLNAKDASESQEQDLPIDDNSSGASFRQENIVQPSSLFDGDNVFERPLLPPLPSSISIRAHIPTLEELNARIPNLLPLDTFARESSNEDRDGDCSENEPFMSSDASTMRSQSSLTPLRPLDDINLDIFQVNPVGSPGPLSSKIPSLNLNSFKTRLALPKNLGLKPVELQSSLGNKKSGLLGATLRFGPARIGSRNRASDILESRLESIPNLDELRDTMRSSASNLLSSHITPKISLLKNSVPNVDTISSHLKSHADNIKAHTENAAKDLHDTLASTLSEARLKSIGIPKTKFAKQQQPNLLEKVASAHEDVNDKLRAIHLDFTDRLSSLHDNILENAKLPKLKLHSAKSTSKLSDMLPLTRTHSTYKHTPAESKSAILLSSNKKSQTKPSKVHKPSQNDHKLFSSQSKSISDHNKSIRPFKLSKAASSLQSKNVNVPKLVTASPNSLFSRPLPKADGFSLKDREPFSRLVLEDIKKPLINPFKHLGDVKITIETTPRPTTTRLADKQTKVGAKHMFKERESTTLRTTRPTIAQRIQDAQDSKGFASEAHPSRVRPPTTLSRKASEQRQSAATRKLKSQKSDTVSTSKLTTSKPTESPVLAKLREALKAKDEVTERPKLRTTKKPPASADSRTKSTAPKDSVTRKESHQSTTATRKSKPQKSDSVSTPKLTTIKTTESPILAKLREAIKARVAAKTKAPEKLVSPVRKADEDMLRSASENNAITVVQQDAMKENVTYKCKMMCVKEH